MTEPVTISGLVSRDKSDYTASLKLVGAITKKLLLSYPPTIGTTLTGGLVHRIKKYILR